MKKLRLSSADKRMGAPRWRASLLLRGISMRKPTSGMGQRISEETSYYWRQVARYLVISIIFVFASLAWIAFANWVLSTGQKYPFPKIRNDVSESDTIGALGILAAVIIALQVSVRREMPVTLNNARMLARQQALKVISFVAGIASIAVGFAVLFHNLRWPLETISPWKTFGSLGWGILLAALAADASFTSQERLEKQIAAAQKEQRQQRVAAALARFSDQQKSRWFNKILQVMIFLTISLLLGPLPLLWAQSASWKVLLFTSVVSALTILVTFVFGTLCTMSRLVREYVIATIGYFVSIFFALYMVLIMAWVILQHGAGDMRNLIISLTLAIFAVGISILVSCLSFRYIPKTKIPGIGLSIVLHQLNRRLDKSKVSKPARASTSVRWSFALAVLCAPAGIWIAHNILAEIHAQEANTKNLVLTEEQKAMNQANHRCAKWALVIAYGVLVLSTILLAILAALNLPWPQGWFE